MELIPCKTSEAMTEEAHAWCASRSARQPVRSLFLPAGNTPTPLYRRWEAERPDYLKARRLLQVDDVLTGLKKGIFRRYFEDNLPSYREQLVGIDLAEEAADLCLLGFGLNGHVAFHEPGLPLNFFSGCVQLSEETKRNLALEPDAWGISYGLAAFLKSRSILLLVSGGKKKAMFERFLNETNTFPATYLKTHADLTVLVDF